MGEEQSINLDHFFLTTKFSQTSQVLKKQLKRKDHQSFEDSIIHLVRKLKIKTKSFLQK